MNNLQAQFASLKDTATPGGVGQWFWIHENFGHDQRFENI